MHFLTSCLAGVFISPKNVTMQHYDETILFVFARLSEPTLYFTLFTIDWFCKQQFSGRVT